jgi:hypothetical protein
VKLWILLGVGALAIVLALGGAALGWYGPLVTCGADEAQLCVAWPRPISAAVWLAWIVLLVALAAWHVAIARRE